MSGEAIAASKLPQVRLRALNYAPINPKGEFVLYWMIAYRRTTWNFSLQRAVEWGLALKKPIVILEALRCDYPWASDRLHRFVLDGMWENQHRLARSPVLYYPYVERSKGAGKGLLAALGQHASIVVTDEFPCFFLPRMVASAAQQLPVRLEQVDSNGVLPLRAAERMFPSAYTFRRFLQMNLLEHFKQFPCVNPLAGVKLRTLRRLPAKILRRWPPASLALLGGEPGALAKLPIDHSIRPVPTRGGARAAEAKLRRFLQKRLRYYLKDRLRVDGEATSGLSPYLHFGHISAHQVFRQLMRRWRWTPARLGARACGKRVGWWGVSTEAEAFLDQLITWRELGFNFCAQRSDYDRYASLPAWAQATLEEHAGDPRPFLYRLESFARAATHDPVWNAAQRQLLDTGHVHNYLRMLWGKKILEWSRTPRQALRIMIELNNRYALDGRDPNSYSGIFWCLGRYDRPWGPERPILGKVRYMSSASTARKLVGLRALRI